MGPVCSPSTSIHNGNVLLYSFCMYVLCSFSASFNFSFSAVNYLQYATATYVPSGIEFECTFAQVSFDIGCMVFVQAENGQNVSKLFNVTSRGDNDMVPVAAGIVSGLERSLQYTYTVVAVRLSDGLKLQPNIILMGSVPPQISGLRRSSDTGTAKTVLKFTCL